MRRGPTPLDAGARSLLRYERMRALASLNGSGFDPLEAAGLQASNVGNGDNRSGERRRAKVRCDPIAIVRAVARYVRDRPRAVPQLARPE